MKILFNTYSTAFQKPGGGEVIILKLKEALEQKGHEVTLFNQWEHKFSDFDLVHEFSLSGWQSWSYYNAVNIPFVLTPTSWPRDGVLNKLKFKFTNMLKDLFSNSSEYFSLSSSLRYPDVICPTTSIEWNKLKDFYSVTITNQFQVIPNGVDINRKISEAENSFTKKFNIDDYLLFVANITPIKNIELAVKMAKHCGKKLCVIGEVTSLDLNFKRSVEGLANEDILFTGPISSDSVLLADAYHGAQAVLIPSFFETCSLVGLEAGSFGTPVVITNSGGTMEIFSNKVHYLNPSDEQSAFKALDEALLKNGQDIELKEYIEKNYSWGKISEQYEAAYVKAIENAKK